MKTVKFNLKKNKTHYYFKGLPLKEREAREQEDRSLRHHNCITKQEMLANRQELRRERLSAKKTPTPMTPTPQIAPPSKVTYNGHIRRNHFPTSSMLFVNMTPVQPANSAENSDLLPAPIHPWFPQQAALNRPPRTNSSTTGYFVRSSEILPPPVQENKRSPQTASIPKNRLVAHYQPGCR